MATTQQPTSVSTSVSESHLVNGNGTTTPSTATTLLVPNLTGNGRPQDTLSTSTVLTGLPSVGVNGEKGWLPPAAAPIMSFKTPKNTMLTMIKAGMAKTEMTWYNTLIMAIASGIFIGFGGIFSITVSAGLGPSATTFGPIFAKAAGGFVFPIALFLIILTGGELFTGDLMILSLAVLADKASFKALLKNWCIVYVGNFAGCVISAYFGAYLAELFHHDPYHAYVLSVVDAKLTFGWGASFLRAIGANWLVCLAVFLGICAESFEGKIIGMWWPIAAFATIGYEHCIANMFYIMLGLMYSSPHTFGQFLARSLIPTTLGNMVAAIFFMACVYYFVYRDFALPAINAMRLRQAIDRKLPHFHGHAVHLHHGQHHDSTNTYEPSKQPVTPLEAVQTTNGKVTEAAV